MNEFPIGLVKLRFCFTATQLSGASLLAFRSGMGLPSGGGVTPASAIINYQAPAGEPATLEATEVEPGLFEATLPCMIPGVWQWEAQALNDEAVVASTGTMQFTVGSALKGST